MFAGYDDKNKMNPKKPSRKQNHNQVYTHTTIAKSDFTNLTYLENDSDDFQIKYTKPMQYNKKK